MKNYKSTDSHKSIQEQLELKANSTFSILKSESDKSGFSHDKFQIHQGVK
jgi:hypothetical protein